MENCISSVDEKNFPSKLFADDIMYKETKVDWKGRALRLKSSLKAGRNFTQV